MAIKFSSADGLNLPKKLVSVSGSWGSAPTNGGIITFSGRAVFFGDSYSGSEISLGKLGTFKVTSTSTDSSFGSDKTSVSFSCILGYLAKTNASVSLAACVRDGASLNSLISAITSKVGFSVSIPRSVNSKLEEPVFIKENQSIISLLNEILVATGCILYSSNGTNINCKTISDFYSGLSGSSNENTINKNFTVDRGGTIVGISRASGTKQIRVNLDSKETISSGDKTITLERSISTTTRKLVTTTENNVDGSKTIVTEEFEPGNNTNPSANSSIMECFPPDSGRIIKKTTENYISGGAWSVLYDSCEREYLSSCNDSTAPLTFTSSGSVVLVEKIEETWDYNTKPEEIVSNPDSYTPEAESVSYKRKLFKSPAYDNISNCNLTYGYSFDFLQDPEDAETFSNTFSSRIAQMSLGTALYEIEEIKWEKSGGSYRWSGTRTKYEARLRTRFNERKARMRSLKVAIDGGDEDYDVLNSDYVDGGGSYSGSDTTSWEFDTFLQNFSSISNGLEASIYTLDRTEEETRADWEPEFSVAPASYRVYSIPWELEEGNGGKGSETISLSVGRFNDYNTVKDVLKEIKEAKATRSKSLAITNINELFKVGEIDAPSFSVDVNGVKSSGVYLNG